MKSYKLQWIQVLLVSILNQFYYSIGCNVLTFKKGGFRGKHNTTVAQFGRLT